MTATSSRFSEKKNGGGSHSWSNFCAAVARRNLEEMPVIVFCWHDQTPALLLTIQNIVAANGIQALPAYLRTPQHPPTSMPNIHRAILHHVRLPNVTVHEDYALMCPDVGSYGEVIMKLSFLMVDQFMTNTMAPVALPGTLPLARVSVTRTVHTVQPLAFPLPPGTVALWG